MTLRITAALERERVAHGERVLLTIEVAEDAAGTVTEIADPIVGRAMTLRVRLPDGATRELVLGELLAVPGVMRPPVPLRVPHAVPRRFRYEVDTWLEFVEAGPYAISARYAWNDANVWESPWLPVEVTTPAPQRLGVTPLEASASGLHTVYWVERDGAADRLLAVTLKPKRTLRRIRGAREIAVVPRDSVPVLSVAPPGLPSPDHWFALTVEGQLWVGHASDTPAAQRATHVIALHDGAGADATVRAVVSPLLAEADTGDGLPEFTAALIRREGPHEHLLIVEIGEHGLTERHAAIALEGSVQGAWATWCGTEVPVIFAAVERAGALLLHVITGHVTSTEGTPRARTFAHQHLAPLTGARCLAGDARTLPDGTAVCGVVLARGDEVTRATVHVPPPGGLATRDATPTSPMAWRPQEMPSARRAQVRTARLDAAGALHALLSANAGVQYAPSGAQITWSEYGDVAAAAHSALVLGAASPPILVHTDAVRGPLAVSL